MIGQPVIRLLCLGLALLAMGAGAREPYESTYVPRHTEDVLLKGATVLVGTGERLDGADVRLAGGRIAAVGISLPAEGARLVDASDRWITPGIIDVHSHLGAYPSPGVPSTSDGNEATSPNTAQLWVEHSVWPQDPQFPLALAGGVTTLQILPGSANLFGGRGVTLKNVPARTVQGMKFPGAKQALKMACGENPKRVYGSTGKQPSTRMANIAGFRAAWAQARYEQARRAGKGQDDDDGEDNGDSESNGRKPDLAMDTLIGVLEGEILVHNHCYRADEMAWMLDVAREYGFAITAFHHAVESYKIADLLAEEGVCSAMWADWWGFKLEAFDAISENVALVEQAGACAIVHSDSAIGIQRLNQEAAKAMAAARRQGIYLDEAAAIRWITLNAAKALGLEQETGSLEVGKAADVVVWDSNPFSIYSRAEQVYIDGYRYYDSNDPARQPVTDFELEQTVSGGAQ